MASARARSTAASRSAVCASSCATACASSSCGTYEAARPRYQDAVRRLILDGASTEDLRRAACADGMRTLHEAGLAKVRQGLTSLAEVLRVLGNSAV